MQPPSCEPLERRRLLAAGVELISSAARVNDTVTTSDGHSPPPFDDRGPAAAVSNDGRYVAVASTATDLVAGPAFTGEANVFVRDRTTGTIACASIGVTGQPVGLGRVAGLDSFSMSSDGRYVAFVSDKPGVVAGDTASRADVFLRDLVAGTTTLVSRSTAGGPASGDSTNPLFAGASRYLFFVSSAPDLTTAPADFLPRVYRYDLLTSALDRVARSGTAPFQVSDDGNVVAVAVLNPEGSGTFTLDVLVHDFTTGVTSTGTSRASGEPLREHANALPFALSADGSTLVFATREPGVTPDDDNGTFSDVFARDLVTGTTTLVSVGPGGASAEADSGYPSVSADGRFVCFESIANLTGRPPLNDPSLGTLKDVFLRDLRTATTRLISTDPTGAFEAGGYFPEMSPDARFVVYLNDNPGTIAGDTATSTDRMVLRDLATGAVTLVNRDAGGAVFDLLDFRPHRSFDRFGSVLVLSSGSDPDVRRLVAGVTDENLRTDLLALPVAPAPPLPTATAATADVPAAVPFVRVDVTYRGDAPIVARTVSTGDVVLTGPRGFRAPGTLVSLRSSDDRRLNVATYQFDFPGGPAGADENGTYVVEMVAGEVLATSGLAVAPGPVPGGSFNVAIAETRAPDLRADALTGRVTPLVRGEKFAGGRLVLRVTNAGDLPAADRVTLRLLASTDDVADAGDAMAQELSNRKINLRPGKTAVFRLSPRALAGLSAAELPDGTYRLIAIINATGTVAEAQASNNAAVLADALTVTAPVRDLAVLAPSLTGTFAPGRTNTLRLGVRNDGNVTARGARTVRARLTTNPADPAAASRTVDVPLNLKLKPGATRSLRAKLPLPEDLPRGTYFVVVGLLPDVTAPDADPSDDTAIGGSTYTY